MIPPTPTPFPQGVEYFSMPDGISLWSSTDTVIQYWNWMGTFAQVAQVMLLLVLVYLAIRLSLKFFNEFIQRDSQL